MAFLEEDGEQLHLFCNFSVKILILQAYSSIKMW